ncbi:MAG: hypothetical protein QG637_505, partial [Chloroflexota bacterium]|nr:hypothetical protein [Chloroflexota bacterium]
MKRVGNILGLPTEPTGVGTQDRARA